MCIPAKEKNTNFLVWYNSNQNNESGLVKVAHDWAVNTRQSYALLRKLLKIRPG